MPTTRYCDKLRVLMCCPLAMLIICYPSLRKKFVLPKNDILNAVRCFCSFIFKTTCIRTMPLCSKNVFFQI